MRRNSQARAGSSPRRRRDNRFAAALATRISAPEPAINAFLAGCCAGRLGNGRSDLLILIPARMASTRLPGKPLADIGGVPMIVQVLQRAQEAGARAGGGRDGFARDRRGRGKGGRPSGDDARRSCVRLGPHFRGARQRSIRRAARASWSIVQGDLPTLVAAGIRARRCSRSPIRRSISPRWRLRSPKSRRTHQSECREGGRLAGLARAACARSISPAPPRRPARGRSITTSGSMPIGARRSSASSSCRPPRSNGARGSSSCGRWKPACASTSRIVSSVPLGVDTPEDLEKARALLAVDSLKQTRVTNSHEQSIENRVSGRAGSQFRHSPAAKPIRAASRCPARPSRTRSPRCVRQRPISA